MKEVIISVSEEGEFQVEAQPADVNIKIKVYDVDGFNPDEIQKDEHGVDFFLLEFPGNET